MPKPKWNHRTGADKFQFSNWRLQSRPMGRHYRQKMLRGLNAKILCLGSHSFFIGSMIKLKSSNIKMIKFHSWDLMNIRLWNLEVVLGLMLINNHGHIHRCLLGYILKTLEILQSMVMFGFTLLEAKVILSRLWMLKSGASIDYNFYLTNDFK